MKTILTFGFLLFFLAGCMDTSTPKGVIELAVNGIYHPEHGDDWWLSLSGQARCFYNDDEGKQNIRNVLGSADDFEKIFSRFNFTDAKLIGEGLQLPGLSDLYYEQALEGKSYAISVIDSKNNGQVAFDLIVNCFKISTQEMGASTQCVIRDLHNRVYGDPTTSAYHGPCHD